VVGVGEGDGDDVVDVGEADGEDDGELDGWPGRGLTLGRADQVRRLDRVAGEQQGQGGDGDAEDGDRSPGGHAGSKRTPVAAVLGGSPLT